MQIIINISYTTSTDGGTPELPVEIPGQEAVAEVVANTGVSVTPLLLIAVLLIGWGGLFLWSRLNFTSATRIIFIRVAKH